MKKNVKVNKVSKVKAKMIKKSPVKKATKAKASTAAKVYYGWKIYKDHKGAYVAGKKMRKNGKVVRLVASGKSLNIVIAKIAKFYSRGYKDV